MDSVHSTGLLSVALFPGFVYGYQYCQSKAIHGLCGIRVYCKGTIKRFLYCTEKVWQILTRQGTLQSWGLMILNLGSSVTRGRSPGKARRNTNTWMLLDTTHTLRGLLAWSHASRLMTVQKKQNKSHPGSWLSEFQVCSGFSRTKTFQLDQRLHHHAPMLCLD